MARLMIIDDSAEQIAMLKLFLESRGHEVTAYQRGREALSKIAEFLPQILLIDLFMPDMDGYEVISQVHKEFSKIPIFAMSGNGLIGHIDVLGIAGRLGANRTFVKPFDLNDLDQALHEVLMEK